MTQSINLAICGASSVVGKALVKNIEAMAVPVDTLYLIDTDIDDTASPLRFDGRDIALQEVSEFDWQQVQLVVFVGSVEQTRQWAESASEMGCRIIDGSRADLVASLLVDAQGERNEAYYSTAPLQTPHATTLMLTRVLGLLQREIGLETVRVTTMQSVAQSGQKGIDELAGQTAKLLNGLPVDTEVFGQQIAFNLLPGVGNTLEDKNLFEQGIERELAQLLETGDIHLSVQAIQLPIFFGECATVSLRTRYPLDWDELIGLMNNHSGIRLDLEDNVSLVADLNGEAKVSISRIRQLGDDPQELSFVLQADSLYGCLAANLSNLIEKVMLYQL